jgi:hypothetical protein
MAGWWFPIPASYLFCSPREKYYRRAHNLSISMPNFMATKQAVFVDSLFLLMH